MAVFRVERNKGYTVMSNHHLRNKELSLKAKGLLSQMLSLPEDWDYTLKGLSLINREKIDAIREAIPLTQTERLTMNSRPKQPKYARNKNILVIGGSGSGKTRFFVKPSLMQMHSSYVVTDPKGTVLIECGKLLQRGGYRIKVLNTINFKKSMRYNPFAYLRSEKDILKLVNTIIANTKGDGEKSGEDFWVKAEKLYYTALIGYIWYEAPDEEKNFTTLLEMINASEAREDDEDFQNPVDLMFERLEEKDPEHFAVKQYKKYKLAAGVVCFKRLIHHDMSKSLKTYKATKQKGDPHEQTENNRPV